MHSPLQLDNNNRFFNASMEFQFSVVPQGVVGLDAPQFLGYVCFFDTFFITLPYKFPLTKFLKHLRDKDTTVWKRLVKCLNYLQYDVYVFVREHYGPHLFTLVLGRASSNKFYYSQSDVVKPWDVLHLTCVILAHPSAFLDITCCSGPVGVRQTDDGLTAAFRFIGFDGAECTVGTDAVMLWGATYARMLENRCGLSFRYCILLHKTYGCSLKRSNAPILFLAPQDAPSP